MYLGHTDLPLTAVGEEQAKLCAEYLKDEKIDAVYSSDLKRAYQTALAHAKLRGLRVQTSTQLREVYAGAWDGKSIPEITENYSPELFKSRTMRDFRYPGGESILEVAHRVYNEIERIARENEGKTILVASHSVAIRSFWYLLCGYDDENTLDRVKFIVNSSYSILTYEHGHLTPGEYGLAPHLNKDIEYLI